MRAPLACWVLLLLAACATPPSDLTAAETQLLGKPALLLGEVHDNPDGHRLRHALLRQRVESGWRAAIAMEQFDRERQADLDRALASCTDADCVIRAASSSAAAGWQWDLYKPTIQLALAYRLPIVAANLPRAEVVRVMREGYAGVFDAGLVAAYGLDKPLPADLEQAQRQAIDAGHCGKLPPQMLPGMVRAQVARDVWMAQVVRDNSAHGVVLLAGNGHVRRDQGVPRWLADLPPGSVVSVGFVEQPMPGVFDISISIAAHERGDPCEGIW